MKMNPELALDLYKFQPINEKSCRQGATPADLDAAAQLALSVTRAHIEPIGEFFATLLGQATLSANNKPIIFRFESKNDVFEAFKVSVLQKFDEPRAKIIAHNTINFVLRGMEYPSAFTEEDDYLLAILTTATAIDGCCRSLAQEFSNHKQQSAKRKGFLGRLFASKKSSLQQAQNQASILIIKCYRNISKHNNCAPTHKTADHQIVEIYTLIADAFRKAAEERSEFIPAEIINRIALKFMRVNEQFGQKMLFEHLEYEINKYRNEGLREDYKIGLSLF